MVYYFQFTGIRHDSARRKGVFICPEGSAAFVWLCPFSSPQRPSLMRIVHLLVSLQNRIIGKPWLLWKRSACKQASTPVGTVCSGCIPTICRRPGRKNPLPSCSLWRWTRWRQSFWLSRPLGSSWPGTLPCWRNMTV